MHSDNFALLSRDCIFHETWYFYRTTAKQAELGILVPGCLGYYANWQQRNTAHTHTHSTNTTRQKIHRNMN